MNTTKLNATDIKLIDALPEKFTRKIAVETVKLLNLSDQYFEVFCRKRIFNQYFERVFHGIYVKKQVTTSDKPHTQFS